MRARWRTARWHDQRLEANQPSLVIEQRVAQALGLRSNLGEPLAHDRNSRQPVEYFRNDAHLPASVTRA